MLYVNALATAMIITAVPSVVSHQCYKWQQLLANSEKIYSDTITNIVIKNLKSKHN